MDPFMFFFLGLVAYFIVSNFESGAVVVSYVVGAVFLGIFCLMAIKGIWTGDWWLVAPLGVLLLLVAMISAIYWIVALVGRLVRLKAKPQIPPLLPEGGQAYVGSYGATSCDDTVDFSPEEVREVGEDPLDDGLPHPFTFGKNR